MLVDVITTASYRGIRDVQALTENNPSRCKTLLWYYCRYKLVMILPLRGTWFAFMRNYRFGNTTLDNHSGVAEKCCLITTVIEVS